MNVITQPESTVLLDAYPRYKDPKDETSCIRIARGFSDFPFGISAYRHTTLGRCLLLAILETRDSRRRAECYQMSENSVDDDTFESILHTFDDIMMRKMRHYLRTRALKPGRKVYMKGSVSSFKNVDNNAVYFCKNARLWEMQSRRNFTGFRMSSSGVKLVIVDPEHQEYELLTNKQSKRKHGRRGGRSQKHGLLRGRSHAEMMQLAWGAQRGTEDSLFPLVKVELLEDAEGGTLHGKKDHTAEKAVLPHENYSANNQMRDRKRKSHDLGRPQEVEVYPNEISPCQALEISSEPKKAPRVQSESVLLERRGAPARNETPIKPWPSEVEGTKFGDDNEGKGSGESRDVHGGSTVQGNAIPERHRASMPEYEDWVIQFSNANFRPEQMLSE